MRDASKVEDGGRRRGKENWKLKEEGANRGQYSSGYVRTRFNILEIKTDFALCFLRGSACPSSLERVPPLVSRSPCPAQFPP